MEPLDEYMLARTAELVEKVRKAYEEFEFHRVFHALNEFCNSELSAFYLDVLKDRLYTLAPKDTRRLSAQTALWKITEALVRLVAPILSFTADEVWSYMPQVEGRESSVHVAHFPEANQLVDIAYRDSVLRLWDEALIYRSWAMKVLEEQRKQGNVGKGLDAAINVSFTQDAYIDMAKLEKAFPEVFNVSQVNVSLEEGQGHSTWAAVPAAGSKCERCWRYTNDVGSEGMYPTVCARCADALEKIGFAPTMETLTAEEQPA